MLAATQLLDAPVKPHPLGLLEGPNAVRPLGVSAVT
jgi:hypothetical protein